MLDNLICKAQLRLMGYEPFQPEANYLHSRLSYSMASFRNRESEPTIYTIMSEEDHYIKVWSCTYNKYLSNKHWPDEGLEFPPELYINKERFVVVIENNQYRKLLTFDSKNTFSRPVIRGLDDRIDLGDLEFIISDAGVLYSLYQHPSHKTINRHNQTINLLNTTNEYANTFEMQRKTIGSYGDPFEINTVHLMPIGSPFKSREYESWT